MKIKRLFASLILGLGMTLAFLWLLATGSMTLVYADTYTVTNINPSGPGSLRQAILDANGNPGPDAITFSPGVSGAIVLTDALPAIGDDLTISGPGAEQLNISGANTYRVFSVTTGIAVTITGVTVRDGNAVNSDGGGIWSAGTLHLDSVRIVSNTASGSWPSGSGGGVYVYEGSATLSGTQVVSNSAFLSGGGVYVSVISATLNVVGGRIDGNSASEGGGVSVDQGSAMLSGTQVVSNSASYGAGGLLVWSGSVMLSGTQVVGNLGPNGGGVVILLSDAVLNMSGGRIDSNSDGGLIVSSGSATLSGTRVAGNSAQWGGGGVLVVDGSATLNGGQVVGNSTSGYGGGVYVYEGSATLSGTQVVGNSASEDGGGVYVYQGSATLSGAQVVSNSATSYGGGVYVDRGSATLDGTQITANDAITGSALYTEGTITPMTALTITGDIYQAGGRFAGGSHDLRIEGSLSLNGGHFYAPANLDLGDSFIHTGGTYYQTRVVTGSSDVGFPKAGGVILNANGQDLGSTEVALTAGANCAGVTAGEAVAHCYMIAPTIATGRNAVVTFYYNNSEVAADQSCTAMEAFRWDSTWDNLLTRDGSYGADGRMCGGDRLSIRVTGVMTFSPFVLNNLAPEITVLPSSLLFGDQDVDAGATVSQAVTITNDGSADLHISAVTPTGDTSEFNLAGNGAITLTSGSTRTIEVSFDPSSTGAKAITLTIQSDDSDEPTVDVTLTGAGIDQKIAVAPSRLTFGSQDVDVGATVSQTVTITNDGFAELHVTSISLTGGDAAHFQIESGGSPVTLTQGGTHTVQVSFDPTTTGAKSANLTIQSDDSDEATVDVALSGTGIAADLVIAKSVTPTIAAPGDTITYTIVLSNAGSATASGVVMTDSLPSAVSFGSQSEGTALLPLPDNVYRWGPYDIAAHTAYTIIFTANVTDNTDFAGQTITNIAYFAATNTAPDSDDAIFTVTVDYYYIYLPLVLRNK